MYFRRFIFPIIITFTVLLQSCSETEIQIPQPCTGDHKFNFNYVDLKLTSDTVSVTRVYLTFNGVVTGNGIDVKLNGFSGTADITGTFCSGGVLEVFVTFRPPNEIHKMKITAEMPYTIITGKILYCINATGNCDYVEIGHLTGYMVNEFIGYFYIDNPFYAGSYNMTFINK